MIRLVIIVLIVALAGPFFIKGPDGEPLMTLQDLADDLPEKPSFVSSEKEPGETITRVYKWQDDEGVWHFSNDPTDANGHEVVEIEGNINTMPLKVRGTKKARPELAPVSFAIPDMMSVSSGQMSEMMETVNGLQDSIDRRKAEIDAAIE